MRKKKSFKCGMCNIEFPPNFPNHLNNHMEFILKAKKSTDANFVTLFNIYVELNDLKKTSCIGS